MADADKRKKVKLDGSLGEFDISDQDMGSLDHWKNLQKSTIPFMHPVRKLVRPNQENGSEIAFNEQNLREEIELLKLHLASQQQLIQQQKERIKVLQEQKAVMIRECQNSGVKLPQTVLTEISMQTPFNTSAIPNIQNPPFAQTKVIPSSSQPLCFPRPSVSPGLPSHAPVIPQHPQSISSNQAFSLPMPRQMMPNISPTSRTPPHQAHLNPPHPAAPTKHLVQYPIIPISSSCNVNPQQNTNISTIPAYPVPVVRPLPPRQFVPQQRQIRLPPELVHVGTSQPPLLNPQRQIMPRPITTSTTLLTPDLTFSPLNSSDFIKLDNPDLNSNYDPFPDDLDNILDIAGLPTGSGAGYGVGVVEDEEFRRSPLHIDLRYVCVWCVHFFAYLCVYVSVCLLLSI